MEKKTFKDWEESTREVLDATWKFRDLCKKPFDRGFIGELLVLERLLKTYKSKLCTHDNGFIYVGSANKGWDISLTINNETKYINTKATSMADGEGCPKWVRQDAKLFCEVKFDQKTEEQLVSPKKHLDNFFYIFVDVGSWLKNPKAKTIFYTLSDREAGNIFRKKYFKGHNKKVRKNKTTDFHVKYEDIKNRRDDNINRIF